MKPRIFVFTYRSKYIIRSFWYQKGDIYNYPSVNSVLEIWLKTYPNINQSIFYISAKVIS